MSQPISSKIAAIAERFGGIINGQEGYIKFRGQVDDPKCKRRAAGALAEITSVGVKATLIESFRGFLVVLA